MLFIMATILMIQLQNFQPAVPGVRGGAAGVIGVSAALLLSHKPMGFVAILGILALIGILIRNSVILIIQIENLLKEGAAPWDAVREATQHRMRPIMLTAAAATLALIPISREIFWGPMAYAMMGGIIVGTVLTLLFLPALYLAWFRIKEPERRGPGGDQDARRGWWRRRAPVRPGHPPGWDLGLVRRRRDQHAGPAPLIERAGLGLHYGPETSQLPGAVSCSGESQWMSPTLVRGQLEGDPIPPGRSQAFGLDGPVRRRASHPG